MRLIGKIDSPNHAQRFSDYLLTLGIHSKIDPGSDGQFSVWILEENQIEQAKQELSEFSAGPEDAKYNQASGKASQIRRDEEMRHRERQKNVREVKPRSYVGGSGLSGAPVTKVILFTCIGIALLGLFGGRGGEQPTLADTVYDKLMFLAPTDYNEYKIMGDSFVSIKRGEVWRLFTPAILHSRSSPLHVAFNMYMLFSIGPVLERRMGSLQFILLNVFLALASNLGQGALPPILDQTALAAYADHYGGVIFVGYSGVLYGLFGYFWLRSNTDPSFGVRIDPSSIFILMVWFLLCWFNILGNIANLAHTFGLIGGLVAVPIFQLLERAMGRR